MEKNYLLNYEMVCWVIKHVVIETQNKEIFSIAHKSFLLLLSYQLNELLLHLENRSFGYALNRDKDYMGRNIMKRMLSQRKKGKDDSDII